MLKVVLLPEELVVTLYRKYTFELWLFHVTVLNKHAVDYTKYYINLMIVTFMMELEALVLFFCFLFRNNTVIYSAAIRMGFVCHGDFQVLLISINYYSSFKLLNYKAYIHTSGKESSCSTVVILRLMLIINVPRGQFSVGY